jgi:16S rRNA (cytidine1402-2'-O)-methyltransferase
MLGRRNACGMRLGIIVGNTQGRLQVIATPIGNLADLSPRAQEALRGADVIAAEDTRHTLVLLQAMGIARPLVSLHDHNELERVPELLAQLGAGQTVALVSDAGTPLLSDPGFELVRQAAAAGYPVHVIPGASAITAALAGAGLPVRRFCFEGFLPPRERERRAALAALSREPRTLVFFEAPHRILDALTDMATEFGGDRAAVVARELTKVHETFYRGSLAQLVERAKREQNFARGEITVVVHGAAIDADDSVDEARLRHTVDVLLKELPPGRAAAIAAQLTGAPRARAYALALRRGTTPQEPEPAS